MLEAVAMREFKRVKFISIILSVLLISFAPVASDARDLDARGTDVSDNNGSIDWVAAKNLGMTFAIVKATDGRQYSKVKYFKEQWPKMKAAGILRGVYHFYQPKDDPVVQANYFADQIDYVGGLEATDLPPTLDIELDGGLGTAITPRILKFLRQLEARTKRIPMIYVSPAFANAHFTDPALARYPLWVAEYGVRSPKIPKIWKDAGKDWTIWQYSERGDKPSVDGRPWDLDVFKGEPAVMREFVRLSHVDAAKKRATTAPATAIKNDQSKNMKSSVATGNQSKTSKHAELGANQVRIEIDGATVVVGPEVTTERLEQVLRALKAVDQ